MNKNKSIDLAKKRFDCELHCDEYNKTHSDSNHLTSLLQLCDIKENDKVLDLGTGNGYVAFELAKAQENASVAGLDIAEVSIARNNEISQLENISNIKFYSYDGINLPFEDEEFTKVVSRYAFHHFPEPENMIKSLHQKIKHKGLFILSDVMSYDLDTELFIDHFQILKNDGHIHFYYLEEIIALLEKNAFEILDIEFNEFTFSRELKEGYISLLENTAKKIKDEYKVIIKEDKAFVTVKGYNIKAQRI